MTDEELAALAITYEGVKMSTGWDVFVRENRQECLDAVPRLLAHIGKLKRTVACLEEVAHENTADLLEAFNG